jgi:hypothetical protein
LETAWIGACSSEFHAGLIDAAAQLNSMLDNRKDI